jgi:hypothetical protein
MTFPRTNAVARSALNVDVPTETKLCAMRLRDITGKSLPQLTVMAFELLEAHVRSKQVEA